MSNNSEFRLSVSKTKTFLSCKKQYHFSYILKLPKKERDYHLFGTFAHKVLENFHNIYIDGCVDPYHIGMKKAFKDAYQEYKEKLTPEMKKECYDVIDSYLKVISTQKDSYLASKVIACEKNFSIKVKDNVILNGMIDRIQMDSDGVIHVADYKTTKNKKYLKDDFFQLLTYCYALLLEDDSLEKIRASYVLLRHKFEFITTEFKKDDILKIKEQYINYADKILSEKDFEPTTGPLCKFCDFLEVCEEGKQSANPSLKYGETSW